MVNISIKTHCIVFLYIYSGFYQYFRAIIFLLIATEIDLKSFVNFLSLFWYNESSQKTRFQSVPIAAFCLYNIQRENLVFKKYLCIKQIKPPTNKYSSFNLKKKTSDLFLLFLWLKFKYWSPNLFFFNFQIIGQMVKKNNRHNIIGRIVCRLVYIAQIFFFMFSPFFTALIFFCMLSLNSLE